MANSFYIVDTLEKSFLDFHGSFLSVNEIYNQKYNHGIYIEKIEGIIIYKVY